jgi:methyl-accepting chemotaxis protein
MATHYKRRKWWNAFGVEPNFKQRQVARILGLTGVYVLISTAALWLVYSTALQPLWIGELPLSGDLAEMARRGPGLRETLVAWATLMMGLSVLFATATGLYLSHKMAGPIYRFKAELRHIQEGKPARQIVLRKGDDFHDVAEAMNSALGRLQQTEADLRDRAALADAVEEVREAHDAVVAALGEIDTASLCDGDRAAVERWRGRLAQLLPKLEPPPSA